MRLRSWPVVTVLLAPLGCAAGCSILNSYGSVQGAPADGAADGPSGDETADTLDASNGDDAGDATSGEAAPDAMDADVADIVSEPMVEEPGPPLPATGAVVVAGYVNVDGGGQEGVLSVLDPQTGAELSREPLNVIGVSYDGLTDVWYIFETAVTNPTFVLAGPPVLPGDPVRLHARKLDTHSGKWTQASQVMVPTPVVPPLLAAPLRDRLAYVAQPDSQDAGAIELVVLDTTTPTQPSTAGAAPAPYPLSFTPQGLAGVRSSANGSTGGEVSLLEGCSGVCQETLVPLRISAGGISPATPVTVGPAQPQTGFAGIGVFLTTPTGVPFDLVALPNPLADGGFGAGTLYAFDSNDNTPITTPGPISLPVSNAHFSPIVVAECQQVALLGAYGFQSTTPIVAIALDGGMPGKLSDPGNTPTNIEWEPYTSTLLSPFNGPAGWSIVAFTLGASGGVPTLQVRSNWTPPADLRPYAVVTRQPLPVTCP